MPVIEPDAAAAEGAITANAIVTAVAASFTHKERAGVHVLPLRRL
jgi:hypothetical protein